MDIDAQAVLQETFHPEIGEMTIREYLKTLLHTLWDEEAQFSGKRPFGNSGWQGDVYNFFVRKGLIPGVLDEHGGILDVDEEAGKALMHSLINEVFENTA